MHKITSLVLGFLISGGLVALLLDAEGYISLEHVMNICIAEQPAKENTKPTNEEVYYLPFAVPGTSLIAEHLVCYEGPFIEDQTDEPVSNVMALMLRNVGHNDIEFGTVVLEREGESLTFQFSHIVSGMSVIVLESARSEYLQGGFSEYKGWTNASENKTSVLDDLLIEPLDMGAIQVTNISDTVLKNITLYHKNYMQDGIFVGGITYETSIPVLFPNEAVILNPEHYAQGYSLIFKAE